MAEGELGGGSNKTLLYIGLGVAVVAVIMYKQSSGSAGSTTTIGGYTAAMAGTDQARYSAAASAFGNLAGVIGGVENSVVQGQTQTTVAGINANENVAVANVNAGVQNAKTQAQVEISQIGAAQSEKNTTTQAKTSTGNTLISTVGSIVTGILKFL